MILESRFAPSVSTRSVFVIALIALLVLPSAAPATKAKTGADSNSKTKPTPSVRPNPTTAVKAAAGSDAKTTPARSARPNRTTKSAFPHAVEFEQGATRFLKGDNIRIEEIRGTAKTFAPGNIYWIKGTYTLASHDRAMLAAFTTAKDAAHGTGPYLKVQTIKVARGGGEFTLFLPMSYDGWPHVSFYDGEGFGGNYFGTGDSVLKRWWGSRKASGSKKTSAHQTPSHRLTSRHQVFIFGSMGEGGVGMLRRLDPNMSSLWGDSDDTVHFKQQLTHAKPGDSVLLLLCPENVSRVRKAFPDLLVLSRSEIDRRLERGHMVFKQGKARDMNVFLLVTPTREGTQKEFRRLVARGKFTPDR
jgi:hypothetical protein